MNKSLEGFTISEEIFKGIIEEISGGTTREIRGEIIKRTTDGMQYEISG